MTAQGSVRVRSARSTVLRGRSRTALQAVVGLIGVTAVVTAALGILTSIGDGYYELGLGSSLSPGSRVLDSNFRYYNGIWLGVGLTLLWIVPAIERRTTVLRLVAVMIFLGGLARVASMISVGRPPAAFTFFAVIELLFPLLAVWQHHIAGSEAP
jgi:hypothetical protein